MAIVKRETKESPIFQGADETIAYTITTTPWASTPTSPSAKIYSYTQATDTYTDKTSTLMTGTASVSSDVITLPAVAGLTAGTRYRVECQFTVSGNVFEPYFWIYAQR